LVMGYSKIPIEVVGDDVRSRGKALLTSCPATK
jgi:hypothetical protein